MALNEYHVGTAVRMTGTFKNDAGVPTDPSAITLRIEPPTGAVIVKTHPADLTRVSAGVYRYDHIVDKAGQWKYRYEGTAPVPATNEEHFWVKTQEVV